ncbi:hypothetical protein ACOI1C_20445 [Bacillus sp. DJP31]|uniref:hypothetical protein n=1 Tax=Bacillus sp. DJP31 TaxID=3409789 RepID=UPI003BB70721
MMNSNHMLVLALLGSIKLMLSVFGIWVIPDSFYDTLVNGISSLCVLCAIVLRYWKKRKKNRLEEKEEDKNEKKEK